MKTTIIEFLKKLVVQSPFLQLFLAHSLASYLAWPVYLIAFYLLYDKMYGIGSGLLYFLIAPVTAPLSLLSLVLGVLLFVDNIPLLPGFYVLLLAYFVFLPVFICLTFVWAARAKERISAAEPAEKALSPEQCRNGGRMRATFFKMLLVRFTLRRLLLAHAAASYLTWPMYFGPSLMSLYPFWIPLVLAPIYLLFAGIFVAVIFLLRLPGLEDMHLFISVWLVPYLVILPTFISLAFVWPARAKKKTSATEAAEKALSPEQLALAKKHFKRRACICILSIAGVLAAIYIFRWSTLFVSAPDMKLVYIPAGEFMMGDPPKYEEVFRSWYSTPHHKVRISKGFYIGATEVTQSQWKAIMPINPSDNKGDDLPVEYVSWHSAVKFCKTLSRVTGKRYRLPTEAEWEYASRAGTETPYYFGEDRSDLGDYAWCRDNSEGKTHPVAQKKPNGFGLYDMYGNVEEWCSDFFDKKYYRRSPGVDPHNQDEALYVVTRGGWLSRGWGMCRSAFRRSGDPRFGTEFRGFRVVMEAK